MTSPFTPGHNDLVKVNWWHDSIIDWMLINPEKTLGECANQFQVSRPWLSRILGSEVFKEHWRMRLAGKDVVVTDAHITLMEKIEGLAHVSLDEMMRRVQEEKEKLTQGQLRETAELALKSLGYGQPKVANPAQNVQIVIQADAIAQARAEMKRVNIIEPETLELPAS